MLKHWVTYCTHAACKIPTLKCKAGLSATLMKSHKRQNRELVSNGGSKSATKIDFFLSYTTLSHFDHVGIFYKGSSLFVFLNPYLSFSFLFFFFPPPPFLLLPFPLGLLPHLSICRYHIWQLSAPD